MATTYTTARATNSRVAPGPGWHREIFAVEITVAITAAMVTTQDNIVDLFYAPAGFTVAGGYISASDLDTHSTPTLAIDVGVTGGDVDLLVDGATVGQGGTGAAMNGVGFGYRFSAATKISAKFVAAAATAAAGTLTFGIIGFMDPDYRTSGEAATAV